MRVGLDEAGKGPVLGSMFVAAVAAPSPSALPTAVDDSKQLTDTRRQELYQTLTDDDRVYTATAEITPDEIDAPETDMNTLTVNGQARALEALLERLNTVPEQVVADASDVDAARFGRRLTERCPTAIDITAAHGADSQYDIVGAASVVAKTAREEHVTALCDEYGPVGSGYPSDPQTRSFLRSYLEIHGDLPPCARHSWATSRRLRAATAQSSLEEF